MAERKAVARKAAPISTEPATDKQAKVKAHKFPKAMGACADLLYDLRNRRLAKKKEADELEEQEKALKEHIINTLPKSEATGAAGKIARVSVVTKTVPRAEDWDKVYAFVKKEGRFDLLQRRLNDGAVAEMWEAGKRVPGVGTFEAVTVSLNKV